MTIAQRSFLTDHDLVQELAAARRRVSTLLHDIDTFAVIAHEHPWIHLDDLLRDLRAAAVTVATLERLQGVRS